MPVDFFVFVLVIPLTYIKTGGAMTVWLDQINKNKTNKNEHEGVHKIRIRLILGESREINVSSTAPHWEGKRKNFTKEKLSPTTTSKRGRETGKIQATYVSHLADSLM